MYIFLVFQRTWRFDPYFNVKRFVMQSLLCLLMKYKLVAYYNSQMKLQKTLYTMYDHD